MRVFLLYEGRRRDNVVDGRWNIDEAARGPLPCRALSESGWVADLAHEFYAVVLREWVKAGFIEEAIIAAIPSCDPSSQRHAPFGVYDLGDGVRACMIPSAAALNDTFPAQAEDLLWVRGPYVYWDVVRTSRAWRWTVYYGANGKALIPTYPADAVLTDDPSISLNGFRSVLFDKTCDPSIFRPLRTPKRFDLLVPGLISVKKGQEALSRILPQDIDVVFAGLTHNLKTGAQRPEVATIKRQLPRARFIGHVDHETLNRLYNEARAVVLFSAPDDPAPRVIVESLAVGTPLVMPRDMAFCQRYAEAGPVFASSRRGPLFRRTLKTAMSHPGDGGAAFRARYAPSIAAERLWLDLMATLRSPVRLTRAGGTVNCAAACEPDSVFPVHDDLDVVDGLLRELNALKLPDGTPVHATGLIGGRPSWSWHQYELWWSWLRPYVSHRALLTTLRRRGAAEICLDTSTAYLRPLLEAHGLKVASETRGILSRTKRAATELVCRAVATTSRWAFVVRARLLNVSVLVMTRDQFDPHAGCDGRFVEAYKALGASRLHFAECFPARRTTAMLRKLFQRQRLPFYLFFDTSAPQPRSHAYEGCETTSLDMSPLLAHRLLGFVASRVEQSRRRYALVRRAFSLCRFRLLVSMDDPWHGNELLAAAQDCGLRTIGVQHGMLGRFHAGWMNPGIPARHGLAYEKLLVWSDYWKNALERWGSQYADGRACVGGPLYASLPETPAAGRSVLVPYETLAPHHEVAAHLERLQAAGVEVLFKARTDVPICRQLKDYGLDAARTRVVLKLTPEVLADVAVAAGVYSTILFDMVRIGRPVAVLETSFRYGHLLLDDGLAELFRRDDPVEKLLSLKPAAGASARLRADEPRLSDTLGRLLSETRTHE